MPAPPTPPPPNVVERGPRPTTVTVGCYLVLALVVLSVVSFLLLLTNLDAVVDAAVRQAKTSGSDQPANVDSIVRATVIGVGVFTLVVNAVVATFAMLALRGRNWARLTVVVLMTLSAIFSFIGLAGSLASPQEGLPGSYSTLSTIVGILQFLAAAGSAVLLLLPASNAWYSRR